MVHTGAQGATQKGGPSSSPKYHGSPEKSRTSQPLPTSLPQKRPVPKHVECIQPRSPSKSKTSTQQDPETTGRGGVKRHLDNSVQEPNSKKRSRRSSEHPLLQKSPEARIDSRDGRKPINPIQFWVRKGHWPLNYYQPNMEHLFAIKRSIASNSRKRSSSCTSSTPSVPQPRGFKSAPYRDPRYKTLLGTQGSFMTKSVLDITTSSKALVEKLLEREQEAPMDSLFRDDIFETTCQKIEERNEARILQDISRLIVPSAESFATFGAKHLDILAESVNEGWNNSVPITGPRPQPDYAVGFARVAFNDEQLAKMSPFLGDFTEADQSYFMATYYMCFPFLTCEVKCHTELDVADRQNAHSMTIAVRAVANLFRAVGREAEIHREILAFSVSHDHRSVRIYGHYAIINGKDTKFYRHPIHSFDFTTLGGKEKWTTYRFVKNVYDLWVPSHFRKICSAVDQLPSRPNSDDLSLPAEVSEGM